MDPVELNPTQQAVVALLGKSPDRPAIAGTLAVELAQELADALTGARELLGDESVWVNKHTLAAIHGCEAHFVAQQAEPFSWTPASARGQVAHKAIELMINWRGEAHPAALVDEALARLVDGDRSISMYVAALGAGEQAELRGATVDLVTKFMDCFPPLRPAWRPVTESTVRYELFDGAITLSGKTDLTLGIPGERVIIDLKSGGVFGAHREDLRFYALLETLRMGLAPRKLATYYLDTARPHVEDVTEGLLRAALRRTVDGVTRLTELQRGTREAQVRPGMQCRWCPVQPTCEAGQAFLARADDPDAASPW
jgi:hypothetical protein